MVGQGWEGGASFTAAEIKCAADSIWAPKRHKPGWTQGIGCQARQGGKEGLTKPERDKDGGTDPGLVRVPVNDSGSDGTAVGQTLQYTRSVRDSIRREKKPLS